jgi:aminopeptidase
VLKSKKSILKKGEKAMFQDEHHLRSMANILIWGMEKNLKNRGGKYEKGAVIHVPHDLPAMPLAKVLQEQILKRGWNPVLTANPTPEIDLSFYNNAMNEDQLKFLRPGLKEFFKGLSGSIKLYAPTSLFHLNSVEPDMIKTRGQAFGVFQEMIRKKEDKGEFSWTLCFLGTQAQAQEAKVSLKKYDEQIIKACYLDYGAPTKMWKQIDRDIQKVAKRLNKLKEFGEKDSKILVRSETDKTYLWLDVGKERQWVGLTGRNIPSFEVYVSPDWRNARGVFYANQPAYKNGQCVKEAFFRFSKGEVVETTAKQGLKALNAQMEIDEGAKRIGEFSLTDKRLSRIDRFMASTLYDENYGGKYGNCHIALGSSYSNTYTGDAKKFTAAKKKALGFNISKLHWDFINSEKKIVSVVNKRPGGKIKEKVIYENGRFAFL